jgi:hypothetical protein
MGWWRRGQQPAAEEFEAPPGIDVPEGMAAVPEEQVIEWAEQLASEANEMAGSRKVPDFIDRCAKIVLPAVCGDDRGRTFSGGTNLLGWNLFVFGYWCRAVEMRTLARNEASAEVAGQLRIAHDSGLGGKEWFGTLQGASYGLAGFDEEGAGDLITALRSVLPRDAGGNFRLRLAAATIIGIRDAIDAQHPGASTPLTSPEMRMCWEVGYWMRAVSISLPDEPHIELREQ